MKFSLLIVTLLTFLGSPNLSLNESTNENCDILFEGRDNNTGQYRKELSSQYLTSYTHPKMRSSLGGKSFLKMEASLSKIGAYNLINLFVNIQSKQAQQTYGSIADGAFLMIQFLDGEKIHAYNVNTDYGVMNPYKNKTTYNPSFTLSDKDLKELEKKEIDRVGILWTTGFEDYEVFEVDFFMNQVSCLKGK